MASGLLDEIEKMTRMRGTPREQRSVELTLRPCCCLPSDSLPAINHLTRSLIAAKDLKTRMACSLMIVFGRSCVLKAEAGWHRMDFHLLEACRTSD